MKRWLQSLTALISRLFEPTKKDASRSTLVGMYLGQANQSTGAGTRARSCREREDGRFAQVRRRES